ncbi:MAG: T9SS type A sorting domain-containing protein [Bacteroidales bacterium]|nr:T9SS type A sorting domain-containing protein [Bacteroidales bacterium]MCF8338338.1 T9SS type A sorting domain-containing protein [Bacteroidales bacterium]
MNTRITTILTLTIIGLLTNVLAQDSVFIVGHYNDIIYDYDTSSTIYLSNGGNDYSIPGYDVDVDNNDSSDFRFQVQYFTSNGLDAYYTKIKPYGENEVIYGRVDTSNTHEWHVDTTFSRVGKPFQYGDTLHNGLQFTKSNVYFTRYHQYSGFIVTYLFNDWLDFGTRYVGGRVNRADTSFFCWFKINVTGSASLKLKAFAADIHIQNNVGIENEYGNDHIKLFPNPADNFFKIKPIKALSKNCSIKIFNRTGQPVHQEYWDSGKSAVKINTARFSAGLYLVVITNPNHRYVKKLLIK